MSGTMHGVKCYAYFAIGGLVCVAADGPDAGRILWDSPEWAPSIVVPSPILFEDGRLFATAGYGAGSAMFKLEAGGTNWTGTMAYRLEKSVFACEQQTPVLRDGLLYGVLPNDAGAHRGEAACIDPADGRAIWTSGSANRFGLGPFLLIGDRMLLLDSGGMLTLASVDGGRFEVVRQAKVLDGHDAWAPMAFVDGLLYLRDATRLVCLDLRAP
jgi:outer membrane protein assembly factor BamB